jgi:inorganic triphosphatase YgiF
VRELELKFALTLALETSLAKLAADEPPVHAGVWSRYFDTPDGSLAQARVAVRVRRHGNVWLQTVKADSGSPFDRFESEQPISGIAPERAALPPPDTALGALLNRTFPMWMPLFETDFERTAWTLRPREGLVVELAQDLGEFRCGQLHEPIREVEIELKRGDAADFLDWAIDWSQREGATLLTTTKNERGLRLAARAPQVPRPVKASAATPSGSAGVATAAAAAVRASLAHLWANLEPVSMTEDAEGPHQLRIALRRLRVAIRYFELREREPQWAAVDQAARQLADLAGEVRDVDVFESGPLVELRRHFEGDAALESLARALQHTRDAARMRLRRALSSPSTTLLVMRTALLAERLKAAPAAAGPAGVQPQGQAHLPLPIQPPEPIEAIEAIETIEPPEPPEPSPPSVPLVPWEPLEPFEQFARRRLHALFVRVRRRARRADDEAGWHRTRIAVKTLRYALEFSTAALPRSFPAARVLGLLGRLQDRLGAGQDLAVARDVAAAAMAGPATAPEAAVRATALIDGWRAFSGTAPRSPAKFSRRAVRTLSTLFGSGPAKGPGARVQ